MSVRIRPFRGKDKTALIALILNLQNYVADIDPYRLNRAFKDFDAVLYVKRMLRAVRSSEGMIFVAEAGHIAGCIVGTISDEKDDIECYPARQGKIQELIVIPAMRGKKVGLMLMQKMEKYFKDSDCEYIRVDCFAPNKKAGRFYEKLGYKDRQIEMLKKIF